MEVGALHVLMFYHDLMKVHVPPVLPVGLLVPIYRLPCSPETLHALPRHHFNVEICLL